MIWNEDFDIKIAENILRTTREGKSYEESWKELAEQFNCSPKDCKDRWEEHLSSNYQTAVQLAEKFNLMQKIRMKPEVQKKQTKPKIMLAEKKEEKVSSKKRGRPKKQQQQQQPPQQEDLTMKQVIEYLQKLNFKMVDNVKLEELEKENSSLKEKMNDMEKKYNQMEEDYQLVISIMSRAQKMLEVG